MAETGLHPLVPGSKLPDDWHDRRIPSNIEVGENCAIDSSFCFRLYRPTGRIGVRIANNVTLWRASLSVEENGTIEIGDDCYLAGASFACANRITLGKRVLISGGVTIVDSDFHPIAPMARMADTIAVSPRGDRKHRPSVEAGFVVIEDDVWIGYNATVLKGVRIGSGAVIAPGSVVTRDVAPGAHVAGNPARAVTKAVS